MSAGMNLEEAKIVANKMTYADAVCNAIGSKCVPYRKATKIKLKELLEIAKSVDEAKTKGCNEISTALYYDGFNDGYNKAIDDYKLELKAYLRRFSVKSVGDKDFDYIAEQLKGGNQ